MASSNRHWPSMFKSKPCNSTHHHQWQHDLNSSLVASDCHRTPFTSVQAGCEERSPDPKPRWNPKPEQIRILEAIFNSGMVNPPRDEIRKIRAQLQEYGQVGDANVFYWFQNRKSRSKHKQRHLQTTKSQPHYNPPTTTIVTTPSSSSSSSDKSSPISANKAFSVNYGEFQPEPLFFPMQQHSTGGGFITQGFCFSEVSNVVHGDNQIEGNCSSLLHTDLLMNHGSSKNFEEEKMKIQQQLSYGATTSCITTYSVVPPSITAPTPTISHIQGVDESGEVSPAISTVFINDVAFEVSAGPINVREAFGDEAVLINSYGQPLLTNEWGVTLLSLQHGAFYYLI